MLHFHYLSQNYETKGRKYSTRVFLLVFNFIPSWPGVFLFFCPFAVKCSIFVEQCIEPIKSLHGV